MHDFHGKTSVVTGGASGIGSTAPSADIMMRRIEGLPRHLPLVRSIESTMAVSMPSGLRCRTWQDGDEIEVCQLLSEAFRDPSMQHFDDDLGPFWAACPGIEPGGVFVVETTDGLPVATATARLDPSMPDVGVLHRVAVRPGYHRLGIGRAVVLRALTHLRERGRRFARVGGMTNALQAVALYLSVGFEPDPAETTHRVIWRSLYEFLSLPTSDILHSWSTAETDGAPWVDGLITEDDMAWCVQCTVSQTGVIHFAQNPVTPSQLTAILRDERVDPQSCIAIRIAKESADVESACSTVQRHLAEAGFDFHGRVPEASPSFYRAG